jgi:hypothetical protein
MHISIASFAILAIAISTLYAADPAPPAATQERPEAVAAASAQFVVEGLNIRRANGEPLNIPFLQSYCAWSRRCFQAETDAAMSDAQRRDARSAHLRRLSAMQAAITAGFLDGKGSSPLLDYYVASLDHANPKSRDAISGWSHFMEDRRANGEALTPWFVDSLCCAFQTFAETDIELCETAVQRQAAAQKHVQIMKAYVEACKANDRPPRDAGRLEAEYYFAAAQLMAAEAGVAAGARADGKPQAAITPGKVADKAREAYEALLAWPGSGERFKTSFIDIECEFSRRWGQAQQAAAHNPKERELAIGAHLKRMKALRADLVANRESISRIQEAQMDYFVAWAEVWLTRK